MKAEITKTIALFLALSLFLSACSLTVPTKAETEGGDSTAAPRETKTETLPSENASETETASADAQPAGKESVWEKKISGQKVAIPDQAFAAGAERCAAMAPDGDTLLMCGGVSPYLYHLESRRTVPLVPADTMTEEYLREKIVMRNGLQIKANEEQMATLRERVAKLSGAALTEELCMSQGRVMPLRTYSVSFYTRENYLLMTDGGYTAVMLIDCESGRYYSCFEEIGNTLCGIHDGKLLSFRLPVPTLYVTDLASLKTETVDFQDQTLFPDGGPRLKAAAFLPDGSLCAVFCNMKLDQAAGQDCVLAVRRPGSTAWETYPLGKILYNREPEQILAACPDQIVVFNRTAFRQTAPFLIDCVQGRVSRLTVEADGSVSLLSPEEYGSRYPEKTDEAVGLLPLDSFADDETLLFQNLRDGGSLLLFRPSDGSSKELIPGLGAFPLILYFGGNHYDRFMDGGYPAEKAYYHLTFR